MLQTATRRGFLGALATGGIGAALLSACGGDTINVYNQISPNGTGTVERRLNLYSWADYDDPEQLAAWGDLNVTVYNSNDDLLAKLTAVNGESGFDVVVPSGAYIPELARRGLLEELDLTRIPNFKQLDESVIDQPWDRHNTYSVCKAWGTIGWIYDSSVIKKPIKTWADFMSAAQNEASGRTAIINTGVQIAALYFWANNKDFNTTSKNDLEKMSKYMLDIFAQHVSAVDSLPYNTILDSQYVLIQGYNGALRTTLSTMKDAGIDMSTWKWGVGAPVTEKFMDNWCIVKGARHLDAAYDFINFMLNPVNSSRSASYIGTNTGTSSLSAMLPPDTEFKEMFFFTKEEIERMETWEYSKTIDFLNEFATQMADKINSGNRIKG
jgi:spermidine/putrescine transport system substrate-binding protein